MEVKRKKGAVLNVTNNCNCKCTYCFTHQNPKEMSFQTAKDAIDFVHKLWPNDEIFIGWFGGEPLLKFYDVIKPTMEWAKEKYGEITWGITTNGTLLNLEIINFLDSFNTSIVFSFDGPQEIQDNQRPLKNNKSCFNAVRDFLPILAKYKDIIFRSTISARNADKVSDIYLFAREYNFEQCFFAIDAFDKEWSQERFDRLKEQFYKIAAIEYDDIKKKNHVTHSVNLEKSILGICQKDNPPNCDVLRCGFGTEGFGISPDGNIYGCQEHSTYLEKEEDVFYLGNIYQGFDKELQASLISKFQKTFSKRAEDCEKCKYNFACFNSNCPSNIYNTKEDFSSFPKNNCYYNIILGDIATIFLGMMLVNKDYDVYDYLREEL